MRVIVLKITGSVFNDITGETVNLLKSYREKVFDRVLQRGERMVVVIGGGKYARWYIKAGEKLGVSKYGLDVLGILASRMNATLLAEFLSPAACPLVPESINEVRVLIQQYPIVVCGGIIPGQSTDAVASLIAEAVGSNQLIVATKVNGVYDKDPSKHRHARLLPKLTFEEFEALLTDLSQRPGEYALFDHIALRIAKRSRIAIWFVNARDVDSVAAILSGNRPRLGTLVSSRREQKL